MVFEMTEDSHKNKQPGSGDAQGDDRDRTSLGFNRRQPSTPATGVRGITGPGVYNMSSSAPEDRVDAPSARQSSATSHDAPHIPKYKKILGAIQQRRSTPQKGLPRFDDEQTRQATTSTTQQEPARAGGDDTARLEPDENGRLWPPAGTEDSWPGDCATPLPDWSRSRSSELGEASGAAPAPHSDDAVTSRVALSELGIPAQFDTEGAAPSRKIPLSELEVVVSVRSGDMELANITVDDVLLRDVIDLLIKQSSARSRERS